MHFRASTAIAAIALVSSIAVTAAFVPPELSRDNSTSSSAQSSDTANLYRINCQMCHGPNGRALIPEMAFVARPKWKHGTRTSDMIKVITEGVKGTPMLPFKSKFTAAQIRALARYVRAFDKSLPPEK